MSITVTEKTDFAGREFFQVKATTSKLTYVKVFEALQRHPYTPPVLVMMITNVTEDTPPDLYDKGDVWNLYDIESIMTAGSASRAPVRRAGRKCPVCCTEVLPEWNYCPTCGQAFERK